MTAPNVKIGDRHLSIDGRDISQIVRGFSLNYPGVMPGLPTLEIELVPSMVLDYDGPADVTVVQQPITICPQCDHCRGSNRKPLRRETVDPIPKKGKGK